MSELEITNGSLKNGDLAIFPSLTTLKVLDKPAQVDPDGLLAASPPNLSQLSINLETLLGCESLLLLLPQLKELNLICDINSLVPQVSLLKLKEAFGSSNNLSSFKFFITDPDLLQYVEFVDIFRHILSTGPVETFVLRLIRKVGQRASIKKWSIFSDPENTGQAFVAALDTSSFLRCVMIDYDLMTRLLFPPRYLAPKRKMKTNEPVSFYLIDYSLSVPKLHFKPREAVANIIQSIGANEVVFIYGEVVDQSHILAMGVISNLLMYLVSDSRALAYLGVTQVSMEKAWSTSDDSLVRHYFESLIDSYDAAEKSSVIKRDLAAKIYSLSIRDVYVFSSPRYRRREDYVVLLGSTSMPIMMPTNGLKSRDSFWASESMMKDLEHYCMREKPLSSIWR